MNKTVLDEKAKPLTPAPAPAQNYSFSLNSFEVLEPRSGAIGGLDKGNDSDYVGFSLQINNGPSQAQTKFIGNNCHSGTFGVDLAFNSVRLSDTDAVALIYTIVNSSAGLPATTTYLEAALTKLAAAAGQALGKLLATEILTDSAKEEIGAAIGAALGTAVVPVIGSALGALGGLLTGEVWGLLFPNCDGPVAASILVYSGAELRAAVSGGQSLVATVNYPGIDSASGCGDNSNYNVTYSVVLAPPTGPLKDRLGAHLVNETEVKE
jgi:hypothetical protein